MFEKNKKLFLILILAIVTFGIYVSNLNNQLFWDDDEWIVANVFVHDFSHIKEIFTKNVLYGYGLNSNYYRPFLLLSFAFNYVLGGINPFGYHIVSNLFHIGNGILLFLLLGRFLTQRIAFLSALIFLIHPLQTEAVTYISGRGDPMSVFFIILSILLFVVYQTNTERKFTLLLYSLLSMFLALLSRETAILLPALLMLIYTVFISGKGLWRSLKLGFLKTIPYWLLALTYFILRLTVFNFKNTLNFYAQSNDYTQNLIYRLYTFGHALVEYFSLIFMPVGLHMERDLALKTSIFQWPVWLGFLIVCVVFYLGLYFYRKNKTQEFKIWFFSWAWFFVSLSPVSGIVPINAVMYEHWLYMPLIGFSLLVAFYLIKVLDFFRIKSRAVFACFIFIILSYLVFFGAVTVKRNVAWGNPILFYEDILNYNPNSSRILNNLGNLYYKEGNVVKAAGMYQNAIDNPGGNLFAQPHYNLGNIYRDAGKIDEAVEQYNKAIEVDPGFPFAYQNLAVIYVNQGDLKIGAEMLEKVKELRPKEARVYYNLGLIYLALRNQARAAENLQSALNYAGNDQELIQEIKRLMAGSKN